MTNFLFESASCQFLFLAVYFLLLQRESMYRFNRFYLLASIPVSFLVPFIDIEIIEQIAQPANPAETFAPLVSATIEKEPANYFPHLLFGVYMLVLFAFALRLGINVLSLLRKIKTADIVPIEKARLALLPQETLPHTFLNTIFLSKTDYENHKIEKELLAHELTHVSQKHTLDVLFIETLIVIFWFNPLLYLYKRAIRLNHEFLADEKVISSCNISFYQKLLVLKASNHQTFELASNLNYLITKKRLIMMTKKTSQLRSALYKLALLPVLTAIVLLLCVEITAQTKPDLSAEQVARKPMSDERDAYYAGVRVIAKDISGNLLADKKYEDLTKEEKERFLFYVPKPITKKPPTAQQFSELKDAAKHAVWIDEKHVPNLKLNEYKAADFAHLSSSKVYKNARSKKFPQPFQSTLYTEPYYEKKLKNLHKKFSGDKIEIVIGDYAKARKKIRKNPDGSLQGSTTPSKKPEDTYTQDEVYTTVEVQPEFPGGLLAFYKYVSSNFKIPAGFKGNGKIISQFVVEKDGSLSGIRILRDIGFDSSKEAERVLRESPKWKPGVQNGKTVRVMYALPISIHN